MNMSYCRFNNTLQDLNDCLENLTDEVSGDEFRARKQLIETCMDILSEAMENNLIQESEVANHLGFEFESYDEEE